jgi:hypothetical protein
MLEIHKDFGSERDADIVGIKPRFCSMPGRNLIS